VGYAEDVYERNVDKRGDLIRRIIDVATCSSDKNTLHCISASVKNGHEFVSKLKEDIYNIYSSESRV
jgi:ATP-dependent helicase YprA (DUF1998 family)